VLIGGEPRNKLRQRSGNAFPCLVRYQCQRPFFEKLNDLIFSIRVASPELVHPCVLEPQDEWILQNPAISAKTSSCDSKGEKDQREGQGPIPTGHSGVLVFPCVSFVLHRSSRSLANFPSFALAARQSRQIQSRQRQLSAAVGPPGRDPNLNFRPLRDRRFPLSKASLQVIQQGFDLSRTWHRSLIPPPTPPWKPPLPNRQRTYLYPEPRR